MSAACRRLTSEVSSSSVRSEEHTSELQLRRDLVCRLLLEKKKQRRNQSLRPRAAAGPPLTRLWGGAGRSSGSSTCAFGWSAPGLWSPSRGQRGCLHRGAFG